MNLRSLWHSIWPPLVAVMLFLLIWQGATAWFHIEKWILPSPVDIGREAAAGAASLGDHTLATLRLMLIGFAIGTLVGLLMAFVLHYVPFLKASLYPLIILSQNVPTIALAPLLGGSEAAVRAIEAAGVDPQARGEALDVAAFARIAEHLPRS